MTNQSKSKPISYGVVHLCVFISFKKATDKWNETEMNVEKMHSKQIGGSNARCMGAKCVGTEAFFQECKIKMYFDILFINHAPDAKSKHPEEKIFRKRNIHYYMKYIFSFPRCQPSIHFFFCCIKFNERTESRIILMKNRHFKWLWAITTFWQNPVFVATAQRC